MTDVETRILSGMKRLEEENRPKYFAMIAIFHVLAGVDRLKEPSVFTHGDYKRAIRIIRVNQKLLSPHFDGFGGRGGGGPHSSRLVT